MSNETQAIIIFGVAVMLTVVSLIISQVYQDRNKDILSSGFMGLSVVFGFVALVSSICVICMIWPQSQPRASQQTKALQDIRSGANDEELKRKYGYSLAVIAAMRATVSRESDKQTDNLGIETGIPEF